MIATMSSPVAVYRDIYTEDQFKKLYGASEETKSSEKLRERVLKNCGCNKDACVKALKERIPILNWLPRYKLKKWLLGDAVAGFTVGIVHIPQGMAFALLTSVAPIYGLYTSFFPVLLYVLFGTGRHVSTGTFAVVSLMTGSVVERMIPRPVDLNSTSPEAAEIEAQKIGVAAAVAFLSGIIMVCVHVRSAARFPVHLPLRAHCEGLTYLSEPIVKAFTSAAAFHVTISQLQNMLGLRLPRYTGPFTIFKTLASVFEALPMTNMAELVISMACLSVLIPVKEINTRFRHKLRTPIPVEILMELLAHGIANTVSSLFSCFPSSATLATTNILESAGGATQLSGLFTSLVVLVVLLLVGPLFYFLPKAVLACINVTSLRQMFLQFQDLPELWRISKIDFCYEIPGVKILAYNGPIYYGNRSFFREAMTNLLGLTPERIRRREKILKALEKKESLSIPTVDNSSCAFLFHPHCPLVHASPSDIVDGEVQAVLIDCSSVIFIDVAGARLFIQASAFSGYCS
ncbi:UNVERIFIED_CONTAM: hypothetical protein FKN15_067034 [Acipenser sinensis]